VVRAAQLKMPSAKMVDSKSPAAGYHFGSGDVDERQSEEANTVGLARASSLGGTTQAFRQTSTYYPRVKATLSW
jgi:hypothetical protein